MTTAAPLLDYARVRREIVDLDVIAVEGRGLVSSAIRGVTGGTVTHVGLAVWWGDVLMMVESREFRGYRAVRLSGEIERAGSVLLYRSRALLDSEAARDARRWAIEATGAPYSYRGCLRFLKRVMPTLCGWMPEPDEDSLRFVPRFCSAFVSATLRLAGADPWPDVVDAGTDPAALVASPTLELLGRVEVVPR